MYRKTTYKQVVNFINNNRELINDIKVMHVGEGDSFNSMEGYHSDIRLKIETVSGYRNVFAQFLINSTYLDDEETFKDWAKNFVVAMLG